MAAGDELFTYCTSCKMNLRHVIIAHKAGNSGPVAKVRCNTCASIHSLRNAPGTTGERAGRSASATPREKAQHIPVAVEWREQLSQREGQPSLPYAPIKDFKIGDVIDHPTFGCGIVRNLKDGNKFEVLFQNDVKVLVHRLKEV